jgi:dTDP-L-rhamnose 4-epimerase
VFEDGAATRDFVHVEDVTAALAMAVATGMTKPVVNVGTGRRTTLFAAASAIAAALGSAPPVISGRFRIGDVRHSQADVSAAVAASIPALVAPEDGLARLAAEVAGQSWADESGRAAAELASHGLSGRAVRA